MTFIQSLKNQATQISAKIDAQNENPTLSFQEIIRLETKLECLNDDIKAYDIPFNLNNEAYAIWCE